ncbi:Ribonuclease H [Senna tora]|uniref:Ribonuclease H n=1 Tax=Senna tora TaxID=362788 RepID=A0A834X199_9FABA|nr:Ribonuclease H [Senna tora]
MVLLSIYHFWLDTWVGDTTLINHVSDADKHRVRLDVNVSNFIHDNKWCLNNLVDILPQHVLDSINTIPLATHAFCEDKLVWGGDSSGKYTTSSGYKLMHDAIPTNEFRSVKGLCVTGTCDRCGVSCETILHCLKDCHISRSLWQCMGFMQKPSFLVTDHRRWIKDGARGLLGASDSISASILFLCTLCVCISWGKEINHEGEKGPRYVQWHKPMEGSLKINTDGSSVDNPGRAGVGVVVRDSLGNWVQGFSGFIGVATNMQAELSAIRQGLKMATDLGASFVEAETDALEALHLIKHADITMHTFGPLIADIRLMLAAHPNFKLSHVLREANQCADIMAKIGSHNETRHCIWEDPPREALLALLADSLAIAFVRE